MTVAHDRPTRAIVLRGGGVTGIAWEIGVLAGLAEGGVDFGLADAVIGTSAGSFVGVAVASSYDLGRLLAAQSVPSETEIATIAPGEIMAAWNRAFETGGGDRHRVGQAFGAIGRAHPEPVPAVRRRRAVEGRLGATEWPATLRVTAIDAGTGVLHVFDRDSGVALVDAVSASGAVPGVWPIARIDGRDWVDGGMVSAANARLADGFDRVIVLAPLPAGYGAIPGAADDVAVMGASASVVLVEPDAESVAAIGPNPYDPDRRAAVAAAGQAQGRRGAAGIRAMW